MLRPFQRKEITIDLPELLVESLGIGAEVLAKYLTDLADSGDTDPQNHPSPLPILCRICERQITPWWFEKHSELCLQEHKAEMDVQMAQESLTIHREAIVKVMDVLQYRPSRPASRDSLSQAIAVYKGMPISPSSGVATHPSSGTASPVIPHALSASRDTSLNPLHHLRSRSTAGIIRPNAKKVELMVDLVDTALDIAVPSNEGQDADVTDAEAARVRALESDKKLTSILHWKSMNDERLGNEPGLRMLVVDSEELAAAKVEAILRHQKLLDYSAKIRNEYTIMVQSCIDDALHKADRIAAGDLSDSSSDESRTGPKDDQPTSVEEGVLPIERPQPLRSFSEAVTDSASTQNSSPNPSQPNSPKFCPTPRSYRTVPLPTTDRAYRSHRNSVHVESEANDSDASARLSIVSSKLRTGSPATSESEISRVARSRDRKRSSLLFAGSNSPRRLGSPDGRRVSKSPLRITKPGQHERLPSPMTSPLLLANEVLSPTCSNADSHHRRQTSVQYSEYSEAAKLHHQNHHPSPRLTGLSRPQSNKLTTSIKDFEIVKPISKGAFGSVHLAKKKSTGDYYAIKVLNKADMKAKNQISNVRAERAIMICQTESDFVAKLLWSFADRNYLYLVMEYMNGGDVAALVKVLGGLSEDWAKKYLAEVILGVQHLHQKGIVHRDLKPDNLLIDQRGHLKLTDFGLSRMGLIKRQNRVQDHTQAVPPADLLKSGPFAAAALNASNGTSRSASIDFQGIPHQSPFETPLISPELTAYMPLPSYFSFGRESDLSRRLSRPHVGPRSESGDSEQLSSMMNSFSLNEIAHQHPIKPRSATLETEDSEDSSAGDLALLQPSISLASSIIRNGTPPAAHVPPPPMPLFDPEDSSNRRFVGTPDYLAPETINGTGQDERSDWWSVGCILFELLYGYPPFHAQTHEVVFERILARKIDWPEEEECCASAAANDLINKLMTTDPEQRLGSNAGERYPSGGDEIRAHPWFSDINWETLLNDEAEFVPAPQNPEDTEYFDARGAVLQTFSEEGDDPTEPAKPNPVVPELAERPYDAIARPKRQLSLNKRGLLPLHIPPHVRDVRNRRLSEPMAQDDFGAFNFKNLGMLEKANQDIIQRLRAETSCRGGSSPSSPGPSLDNSPLISSLPILRQISTSRSNARPASPSISSSQSNASPHRISQPSSPLFVSFSAGLSGPTRKVSGAASGLINSINTSLPRDSNPSAPQSAGVFKMPAMPIISTTQSSPSKSKIPTPTSLSPHKLGVMMSPGRSRAQTVGSPNGNSAAKAAVRAYHSHRRSQVIERTPSSSDEDAKKDLLLKVRKRRQSSRRLSAMNLLSGPMFRPLDVLICEGHPTNKLVMERLLEKLRCRTVTVESGAEAARCAMGEVKFDLIMMNFKLPQINGEDVAKMIKESKGHANTKTPIVAVTQYLADLFTPQNFEAILTLPISTSGLIRVISQQCNWKPEGEEKSIQSPLPPYNVPNQEGSDSPGSSLSSGFHRQHGSVYKYSSREDSISSSHWGDTDSVTTEEGLNVRSRKATNEWLDKDSSFTEEASHMEFSQTHPRPISPRLVAQVSAPAILESVLPTSKHLSAPDTFRFHRDPPSGYSRRYDGAGGELGDDEDDDLADTSSTRNQVRARSPRKDKRTKQRSSRLGIEMMRTNSHGSVVSGGSDAPAHEDESYPPAPLMDRASPSNKRHGIVGLDMIGDDFGQLSIGKFPDFGSMARSIERHNGEDALERKDQVELGLDGNNTNTTGDLGGLQPPIALPRKPDDQAENLAININVTPRPSSVVMGTEGGTCPQRPYLGEVLTSEEEEKRNAGFEHMTTPAMQFI